MAFKFEGRGLAVDKPFRVEILDPATGQPLSCTIADPASGEAKTYTAYLEVLSSDSAKARKFQNDAFNRRNRSGSANRRLTAEEVDSYKADYLAALTVGWCLISPTHDLIDEPFSEAAARDLYSQPDWAFYRDAADAAVGNRANFTQPSPQS